jgi:acylphosphatase
MTRTAARLVIEGHVQGVGYRWWTAETARGLGLAGWVRNRRDGSVEILAVGEADAVNQLGEACGRGPPHAAVRSVDRYPAEDDGAVDFALRETH